MSRTRASAATSLGPGQSVASIQSQHNARTCPLVSGDASMVLLRPRRRTDGARLVQTRGAASYSPQAHGTPSRRQSQVGRLRQPFGPDDQGRVASWQDRYRSPRCDDDRRSLCLLAIRDEQIAHRPPVRRDDILGRAAGEAIHNNAVEVVADLDAQARGLVLVKQIPRAGQLIADALGEVELAVKVCEDVVRSGTVGHGWQPRQPPAIAGPSPGDSPRSNLSAASPVISVCTASVVPIISSSPGFWWVYVPCEDRSESHRLAVW